MTRRYQRGSKQLQFFLVCLFSISLIVIDVHTKWLVIPRNYLSFIFSPVQLLASAPKASARWVSSFLVSTPSVKIAYENLQKEYFQLKSEAILLRGLQQENTQLRELLGAQKKLKTNVSLAKIIDVNIDPYNHRILISKGLNDGVFEGQVVVDDKGVIGQVTKLLPYTSSVTLITAPEHIMPIEVKRNGLRTTVHGVGDLSRVSIPYLNQNADIKVGDILLSSGLGGRFPKGYPVAKITRVNVVKDEAFLEILAEPITGLRDTNHILLLSYTFVDTALVPIKKNIDENID